MSFLQTKAWADFKSRHGWHPYRVGDVFVLGRAFWFGPSLLYAPETDVSAGPILRTLLGGVDKIRTARTVFFRLEIAKEWDERVASTLRRLEFRKSFESVQPEHRAVLDIRPEDEQILSAMKPKGRYNIKVAERNGVSVSQENNLDAFYRLYTETAAHDKFTTRPKSYFDDFIKSVPGTVIWIARIKKRPIATALVVFYKDTASYLYGGTSREAASSMPAYLLHWEAIREAKRRNSSWYDFGEIPPTDNPNHPLFGLRSFKLKFGAKPVRFLGSWDYVYRPILYTLYRMAEKSRRGFRAA
jgi:peptidoglycan pentaglycine glycine transferase (the first glycine)